MAVCYLKQGDLQEKPPGAAAGLSSRSTSAAWLPSEQSERRNLLGQVGERTEATGASGSNKVTQAMQV